MFLHKTLPLDSEEVIFPVKHYESLFDLLTNIPQFFEPSINENFICIFSYHIKKFQGQSIELFHSCRVDNAIMFNENLVSYFSALALMC